jgi:hypothetical protein
VPTPELKFSRADPPSSECPHATSTRAGRVLVAPHRFEALSMIGALDGPLEGRRARFIDLPEGTDHLAIERARDGMVALEDGFDVRTPAGALTFVGARSSTGDHVLARREGYHVNATWHPWSGGAENGGWVSGGVSTDGERLACALRGDETLTLVTNRPEWRNSQRGPARPQYTQATLGSPIESGRPGWFYFIEEDPGVGAIDGNGYTALTLESGRFLVLLPIGDEEGYAIVGTEARVEAGATDLSIVPPFAMVLYGGGAAGALVARRDKWTTSLLHARRPDGSLAWSMDFPFVAHQPPIDGDGRVYVVGDGIAAVDMEGKPLWCSPSSTILRAQAFMDGTLAVVDGAELQILGIDGRVRQSFRAEEELTSYPAIGSDGAVWVASAKTLYMAR